MSLAWHAPGRRSIRCNTERMGSTPASLQHKTSCDDGVACGAANGFSKSDSDDSNISLRARAWATKARRKIHGPVSSIQVSPKIKRTSQP